MLRVLILFLECRGQRRKVIHGIYNAVFECNYESDKFAFFGKQNVNMIMHNAKNNPPYVYDMFVTIITPLLHKFVVLLYPAVASLT